MESLIENASVTVQAENHSPFMTAEETAKFLRVSIDTLYHWRLDGFIPYYKNRGKLLFDRSEVIEWMKVGRVGHGESI